MSEYFSMNVVAKYCMIAGVERSSLKFAPTPFLDESKDPNGCVDYGDDGKQPVAPLSAEQEQNVRNNNLSAANKRTRKLANRAATRAGEKAAAAKKANKKPPAAGSGFECKEGELNRNAASVCMAGLYGCRLTRFDCLRAIQRLAENFHKWTPLHSKKLHRLIEYLNSTWTYKQYGFIGDPWEELELCLWVDADLASDRTDHKSTSGGLLCLVGPNSFFPIGAYCKKQGAQSLSTPEAEIVALTKNLQELVYPMLGLFELILRRKKGRTDCVGR